MLEQQTKNGMYTVKLNLRLPSNILHAEKSDDDLLHCGAQARANFLEAKLQCYVDALARGKAVGQRLRDCVFDHRMT
jgi:hypothetical protein